MVCDLAVLDTPPSSDNLTDVLNSLWKKIMVLIWNYTELNALSNENKLNYQPLQKYLCFGQRLDQYEYTENVLRLI